MDLALLSWPARAVRIAVTAVAVVLLVWAVGSFLERRSEARETRAMVERFQEARSATDRCRNQLAREEAGFRRLDRQVDSLLARVRAFESEEGGGVPEEEYDRYLEVFDTYNASVERWKERAVALRSREATCRDAVELHNALVDSVRQRLGRDEPATSPPAP